MGIIAGIQSGIYIYTYALSYLFGSSQCNQQFYGDRAQSPDEKLVILVFKVVPPVGSWFISHQRLRILIIVAIVQLLVHQPSYQAIVCFNPQVFWFTH